MFRLLVFFLFVFASFTTPKATFKTTQLKHPRVKAAFQEKGKLVNKLYTNKNLNIKNSHIFIRVFKQEDELELWAKSK